MVGARASRAEPTDLGGSIRRMCRLRAGNRSGCPTTSLHRANGSLVERGRPFVVDWGHIFSFNISTARHPATRRMRRAKPSQHSPSNSRSAVAIRVKAEDYPMCVSARDDMVPGTRKFLALSGRAIRRFSSHRPHHVAQMLKNVE
jgi:hypothetical protein